ncbi:uncharacterized protein [Lepeophtheirus salmonis]|uniref:uncharacterized protein n=1 Tax=Lepeophtheirus salmonis TaxID=72036 RepID=UPI001AE1E44A|nr:uncharacterized protein LOC121126199 [Lepeophtheirus salmonis]
MSSSNFLKIITEPEVSITDAKSDSSAEKFKYSTRSCSILNCPNPKDTSYHFFPSNQNLRETWIGLCDLKKSFRSKTSRICGKHFTDDNFTYSSLRDKLTSEKSYKRRLKPDALPSINISKNDPLEFVQVPMTDSYVNTESPNIAMAESINLRCMETYPKLELMEEPKTIIEIIEEPKTIIEIIEEPKTIIQIIDEPIEEKSIESTTEESICVSKTPFKNKKCDNYECRTEIQRYKTKVRNLQRSLKREKKRNKINTNKIVKDSLSEKGLSTSQVSFLMGKTNRPGNFSQDEIINSLLLRTISARAYNFLRQEKLMCLPAPSTLSNWIKDFKIDTGSIALKLKEKSTNLSHRTLPNI